MEAKLQLNWKHYVLDFKFLARTSRDSLQTKDTYFITIYDPNTSRTGIGECALLKGLSLDDPNLFEEALDVVCEKGNLPGAVNNFPAIQFGIEMALRDLEQGGKRILFQNDFSKGSKGIPINGLIWMESKENMSSQIKMKIEEGYTCIKLKIGSLKFDEELEMLTSLRKEYKKEDIEIRVDANGAFSTDTALEKLKRLSELSLHSIEQPIAINQWEEMAFLCSNSELDIAVDEELIPLRDPAKAEQMLDTIKPAYLVLKPSLLGGFARSENWIRMAEDRNISWWITSALESNIGLNAISQWCSTLNPPQPYQGLGTGQLYHNNFDSPLYIENGHIRFDPIKSWDISKLIGFREN